jgi:hypothetical protein
MNIQSVYSSEMSVIQTIASDDVLCVSLTTKSIDFYTVVHSCDTILLRSSLFGAQLSGGKNCTRYLLSKGQFYKKCIKGEPSKFSAVVR